MVGEAINILMIDDNPGDAYLIDYWLTRPPVFFPYTLTTVGSIEEGISCIRHSLFDVCLLDLTLPGFRDIECYRKIKSEIPGQAFIVLAGPDDEYSGPQAMKEGANSFLVKEKFSAKTLKQSILFVFESSMARQIEIESMVLAQEKERNQLSRDLDDSLGQYFVALKLGFSEIKLLPQNSDAIERFENSMDAAINEYRNFSQNLNSPGIENKGFRKALVELVERIQLDGTAKFELDISDLKNYLSPAIETELFRICQDLVFHSLKQSNPSRIFIQLYRTGVFVVFDISDDGSGFNLTEEPWAAAGLNKISERVKRIDGLITILSSEKQGTHVMIKLQARGLRDNISSL